MGRRIGNGQEGSGMGRKDREWAGRIGKDREWTGRIGKDQEWAGRIRKDPEGSGRIGNGQEGSGMDRKDQEGSGMGRKDQEWAGRIRKDQEWAGRIRNGQEGSGMGRKDQEWTGRIGKDQGWAGRIGNGQEGSGRIRKRRSPVQVDFIWITRDQQHLQWFLSLLAELETEQAELEPGGERGAAPAAFPGKSPRAPDPRGQLEPLEFPGKFLELHLYMTSALGRGDVKALGLQLALDLLAAREERDSITGLRTRTQPGRPSGTSASLPLQVFGKVAAERRGKVRVFFCGSAGLAKVIRRHCRSFGFAFSKENF
ncbi:hypothetical protein DUI87_29000 [Hirundo rustica rustica]|uniref:Ferric reductase NAD binding domain-containing protein n=1 Tax=Hirundo rustica rustica TaxID=333673 RepID=A0A3M0IZK2_HIRRU|nr:hypothetical protein DUI87_29000 [Hirundo rustica rustica]